MFGPQPSCPCLLRKEIRQVRRQAPRLPAGRAQRVLRARGSAGSGGSGGSRGRVLSGWKPPKAESGGLTKGLHLTPKRIPLRKTRACCPWAALRLLLKEPQKGYAKQRHISGLPIDVYVRHHTTKSKVMLTYREFSARGLRVGAGAVLPFPLMRWRAKGADAKCAAKSRSRKLSTILLPSPLVFFLVTGNPRLTRPDGAIGPPDEVVHLSRDMSGPHVKRSKAISKGTPQEVPPKKRRATPANSPPPPSPRSPLKPPASVPMRPNLGLHGNRTWSSEQQTFLGKNTSQKRISQRYAKVSFSGKKGNWQKATMFSCCARLSGRLFLKGTPLSCLSREPKRQKSHSLRLTWKLPEGLCKWNQVLHIPGSFHGIA